jgi:protein-serine/threonine kinase
MTRSTNVVLTPRRPHEEDGHDQIGSNGSTPPGAATPRPDPTDKRLPGILHSYFGQVRDSLLPHRKSSNNNSSPAPAPSSAQGSIHEDVPKEKEGDAASRLRSHTLPSPSPSASSRQPSPSQLKGEPEKLTDGDFASPHNQATPPQTPRSQSHESRKPQSRSSLASTLSAKSKEDKPAVGPPKGKLLVSISEGRGLRPSIDPYVVCQFQWAEYISDGPRNDAGPREAKGRNAPGMSIKRTESDMRTPMAIPMRSRQSSHNGTSSDPRENGALDQVTDPRWEHDAVL